MQKKIQTILLSLLWFVQLTTVLLMMYKIWVLDYFPSSLYTAILVILVSLSGITGILLVIIRKRIRTPSYIFQKIVGVILAVSVTTASVFGANVVQQLSDTVNHVTSEKSESTKYGVYVMKTVKAKKLSDIKDYTFVIGKSDEDKKAIKKIKDKIDGTMTTIKADSPVDAVKTLYEAQEQSTAIVINKAYIDVIMDIGKYAKFDKQTRCVYTVNIKKKKIAKINSDIVKNPFVMYLSGSDTRDEELTTSRSDVNIMMVVNPVSKQILMVNTPRDYYIPNPVGGGALDKLTHCGIYGIDVSMQALSDLYDEQIDYYAQINFSGFEKVIDALGGIDVDIPEGQEVDIFYSDSSEGVHAGVNHLDGKRALAFARERYAYEDGDNQRGRNQMYVISLVLDKLQSGQALKSYSQIFDSIKGMFTTNLSSEQISDLVKMQLQDMAKWNIKSYAVTGSGSEQGTYSSGSTPLYVMMPDYSTVDKAVTLINKVVNGETLTDEDINGTSVEDVANQDYESINIQ